MKAVIELSCHSGEPSHKYLITCLLCFLKTTDRTPQSAWKDPAPCSSWCTENTYFISAVLWNIKQQKSSGITDKQPVFICAGLSFFCLCSLTNRDHHPLRRYPPSPSSRDLTHLPLIVFQPSAPLSPLVNTETLNTAQTVREKLQHAFYTLHSPTVLPAWAQSILRLRGEMKKCIWGDFRE